MLRLVLLLAVSIRAAGANAQTLEEEVALVVYGFEAGRATGTACGDIQAPKVTRRISDKIPGSTCSNGDWFETVFRQIDGCEFETFFTINGG